MSGSYRVAPIFLIRMAGVPFEPVARLATTAVAAAARELLVRQTNFPGQDPKSNSSYPGTDHGVSDGLFRAWRKAIRTGVIPPATDPPSQAFADCAECASRLAAAEARLHPSSAASNSVSSVQALLASCTTFLPSYLVFVAEGLRERLLKQSSHDGGPLRAPQKGGPGA